MKLFALKVSQDGHVDVASSESNKSRSSSSSKSSSSSRSSSSDDTFKSIEENIDEKSNVEQPRKFVGNLPSFNIEVIDDDEDDHSHSTPEH